MQLTLHAEITVNVGRVADSQEYVDEMADDITKVLYELLEGSFNGHRHFLVPRKNMSILPRFVECDVTDTELSKEDQEDLESFEDALSRERELDDAYESAAYERAVGHLPGPARPY